MLMNDKIIFDRYYCINFAETKEILVHYILQPHHIFIRIKISFLCSVFHYYHVLCVAPGNEHK